MQQSRTQTAGDFGQVPRALHIAGARPVGVALGCIDRGIAGGIDDDRRRERLTIRLAGQRQ